MMNKSLRGGSEESSDNRQYGFRGMGLIADVHRGARAFFEERKKRAAGDRRL
jgi:hypothetical protein